MTEFYAYTGRADVCRFGEHVDARVVTYTLVPKVQFAPREGLIQVAREEGAAERSLTEQPNDLVSPADRALWGGGFGRHRGEHSATPHLAESRVDIGAPIVEPRSVQLRVGTVLGAAALLACEGRSAAPRVEEVAQPVAIPAPGSAAVEAVQPAVAVPAPGSAAGVDPAAAVPPPIPPEPGARVMHPIVRHRSTIRTAPGLELLVPPPPVDASLAELADEQVLFVLDGHQFVVFPTGAAAVARPPAVRELPGDARDPVYLKDEAGEENPLDPEDDRSLDRVGGRWPDAMFAMTSAGNTRAYYLPEVWRWSADTWKRQQTHRFGAPDLDLQWGYVGIFPWVEGGLLGVRDLVCGTVIAECEDGVLGEGDDPEVATLAAATRRVYRGFSPLVVAHGEKTALPKLPAGGDAGRIHATASGDIFVPRDGSIDRWSVASGAWRTLPLPTRMHEPTLHGRDPAHLVVRSCEAGVGVLAQLVGEAFVALDLPAQACLDVAVERDGTLWALHGNYLDPSVPREDAAAAPVTELWRRPVGGGWERVTLAPLQLDATPRWISDGLTWTLAPAQGPVHPVPLAIVALAAGDVFVHARIAETGDRVLLRDRPLPATIIDLEPTQVANYVHETGLDGCVAQHMVIATFDRPAAIADEWSQVLAELRSTPGARLYEVPGIGDNWRLIVVLTGPPHAPAGRRAALTALRARLLAHAPDIGEPQCGLPGTPRREHTLAATPP